MCDKTTEIRPLRPDDKETIFKWISDPELRNNIGTLYPPTPGDHDKWFDSHYNDKKDRMFVITVDDNPIGIVGLANVDFVSRSFEIYYYIGKPENRGKGYAKSAVRQLLDFYFMQVNMRKAYARVFEYNLASANLLLGLGFENEAILKKHIYRMGEYRDVYYYCKFI